MQEVPKTQTATQEKALRWLKDHGGDAHVDKRGRVLAKGDYAPTQWVIWNRLIELGLVERHAIRRLRVRSYDEKQGQSENNQQKEADQRPST